MDNIYPLIDTHAHLEEIENLDSVIERARQKGLIAIIAVGSDYKSNNKVLEISEKYSSFVYPALGLHPWNLLDSSIELNLNFIETNIKNAESQDKNFISDLEAKASENEEDVPF